MSFTIRTRPVFKTAAIDDQEKFQLLPQPTGAYPFHLDIKKIIPDMGDTKMVFHLCGDTGGLTPNEYNHKVANAMITQFEAVKNTGDTPQFFFHLGDVVYNYGQQAQYYPQFFNAYKNYPAPVFAIPGNHDADVDPLDPEKPHTLQAFREVFCNALRHPIEFAGDSGRKSNIQPHVYFTLKTPLADFICLYSNVPRFGTITDEQRQWFLSELRDQARSNNEKALLICLHHSAYSADTNHGSSLRMQQFLNSAFEETGIYPDAVFSGHVHNYQHFEKLYPNGIKVPFIVAGAGGYAMLHSIAPLNDTTYPDTSPKLDNVELKKYCDDNYGFFNISIEKKMGITSVNCRYFTLSRSDENNSHPTLYDAFTLEISNKDVKNIRKTDRHS